MVRQVHVRQPQAALVAAGCGVAGGHGEQGDERVIAVKEETEEDEEEEGEEQGPLAHPHVHWSRNGEFFPADADDQVAPSAFCTGVRGLPLTSLQQIALEGRLAWIGTTDTLRSEQVDWDPIHIMSLMKCYEDQQYARGTPVTLGVDYFIRHLVRDYYILRLHSLLEGQVVPPFYCAHLLGSCTKIAEEDAQLVPPSFDPEATMAYGYICHTGRIKLWTTKPFANAYVSADTALEDIKVHGLLPEDRFAALLAPSSRPVFYGTLFKCCASDRHATFEVDMLRPDNTPQRATLEVWPVLRRRGAWFSLCITVTEIVDASNRKRSTVGDVDAFGGRTTRFKACRS